MSECDNCGGNCTCEKEIDSKRNDDYIDGYLKVLGLIWKKYRDLRFGQFILNPLEENELYDIEDEALMKDLDKKYSKW